MLRAAADAVHGTGSSRSMVGQVLLGNVVTRELPRNENERFKHSAHKTRPSRQQQNGCSPIIPPKFHGLQLRTTWFLITLFESEHVSVAGPGTLCSCSSGHCNKSVVTISENRNQPLCCDRYHKSKKLSLL